MIGSAIDATRKYAFWEFRQTRRAYLSLVTILPILRSDPQFVVRLLRENILRVMRYLRAASVISIGEESLRMNSAKFDDKVVPSFQDCPSETPRFRPQLMRLAAWMQVWFQLLHPEWKRW